MRVSGDRDRSAQRQTFPKVHVSSTPPSVAPPTLQERTGSEPTVALRPHSSAHGGAVARVSRKADRDGAMFGDHEALGALHRVEVVADARPLAAGDEREGSDGKRDDERAKRCGCKHGVTMVAVGSRFPVQ